MDSSYGIYPGNDDFYVKRKRTYYHGYHPWYSKKQQLHVNVQGHIGDSVERSRSYEITRDKFALLDAMFYLKQLCK